ncbi:MAG: AAA family ATPase [Magnetococcales bacterium]|nr:AAA family ATPase [Magnetococcales bacterium]
MMRTIDHSLQLGKAFKPYQPWLGCWLLKLSLKLYSPSNAGQWMELVQDEGLVTITGLPRPVDTDSEEADLFGRQRPGLAEIAAMRKKVERRLQILSRKPLDWSLPLFKNIRLLSGLLDLDEGEQGVLLFASALGVFPQIFKPVTKFDLQVPTKAMLARIIADMVTLDEEQIMRALRRDATLLATGLVELNEMGFQLNIESALTLMSELGSLLLLPGMDQDKLMASFLQRSTPTDLTMADFPHLDKHAALLMAYVGSASRERKAGVNLFFHGAPGTGKTGFAKALAAALGLDLYEVQNSNEDGDPIIGTERLKRFNLCQRFLGKRDKAMLLFDEVEDVLPFHSPLSFLFGESVSRRGTVGKAWINGLLEHNRVPAFWLSNTSQLDGSHLRRFNYSVEFPTPPKPVRLAVARRYLGEFQPDEAWLSRLVENEALTPAQLEQAAIVARVGAAGDAELALKMAEMTILRSGYLLGQTTSPGSGLKVVRYDPAFVNADVDLARLTGALNKRPCGSFLFSGPPGTGKSELARHLADNLGLPVLAKRASDLLSKWVGDNERNLAAMFRQAKEREALLVLDEADSFLADRRQASSGWEVTMVNEMLTQMEAFPGIFVATTNLDAHLDQASMRRFTLKVRFEWLTPAQAWSLFQRELAIRGVAMAEAAAWEQKVRSLSNLAPGDFAVALWQAEMWGDAYGPAQLYAALDKECQAKEGGRRRMGFV